MCWIQKLLKKLKRKKEKLLPTNFEPLEVSGVITTTDFSNTFEEFTVVDYEGYVPEEEVTATSGLLQIEVKEEAIEAEEAFKELTGNKVLEEKVEELSAKVDKILNKEEEQPMYKFSDKSLEKLSSCHPDLQKLMKEAIKYSVIDFGISCGTRNQKEQDEAYRTGRSKLQYPNSKHNQTPSLAVDVFAYVGGKVSWELKYYYYLAGVIMTTAKKLDIDIRWGGNFNENGSFSDDSFVDCPHFELKI